MELTKKFEPPERQCDGCTMCCEGWLSATALGHTFYPGQPCHWVGCGGCTVYADRPEVCSAFICAWRSNHVLPEWFKPNLSNVIGTWNIWKHSHLCGENETGTFLQFVECGDSMGTKHLTWLAKYAQAGALNVKYKYKGIWHAIGTPDFVEWANSFIPALGADDVKEEEEAEANVKLERARNPDGTYKADDPSTPDVNEAWVEVEEDTTKPQ